jgi:hypothetical protein
MLETLWLIHSDEARCDAFRDRFRSLPGARVVRTRFEDLDPHDCFVTAGNSFGLMTAGIDAAVARFFGEPLVHRLRRRIMDEFLSEQPVGTAFVEPTGHPEVPFLVQQVSREATGGWNRTRGLGFPGRFSRERPCLG